MGRKAKYTFEQKLKACEDYLSGHKSASVIAEELSMEKRGEAVVRCWAKMYQANGPDILKETAVNSSYSKEFKTKVVEEYLCGAGSLSDLDNGDQEFASHCQTVMQYICNCFHTYSPQYTYLILLETKFFLADLLYTD